MEWIWSIPKVLSFINQLKDTVEKWVPVFRRTEKFGSALRLKQVVDLMSESVWEDISVAKMAQIMCLEKEGDLKKYLSGKEEPSFQFLEKFSTCFCVNKEWLKFGTGCIFEQLDLWFPQEDFLRQVLMSNPETIYFVREDSQEGCVSIVLSLNSHKFLVIPNVVNLSSHVGGTGTMQLVMFYKMLVKLINMAWEKDQIDVQIFSCYMPPKDYQSLAYGAAYPGALLYPNVGMPKAHWWDDFIYIRSDRQGFKDKYGEEFVKAQKIVLNNLNKVRNEEQFFVEEHTSEFASL